MAKKTQNNIQANRNKSDLSKAIALLDPQKKSKRLIRKPHWKSTWKSVKKAKWGDWSEKDVDPNLLDDVGSLSDRFGISKASEEKIRKMIRENHTKAIATLNADESSPVTKSRIPRGCDYKTFCNSRIGTSTVILLDILCELYGEKKSVAIEKIMLSRIIKLLDLKDFETIEFLETLGLYDPKTH